MNVFKTQNDNRFFGINPKLSRKYYKIMIDF